MSNHPSSQEEKDESYFSTSSFRRDPTDARSSHADALHADALGREITPQDIARTEYSESAAAESTLLHAETDRGQVDNYPPQYADEYSQDDFRQDDFRQGEFEQNAASQETRYAESSADAELAGQSGDRLYGSHQPIGSTYFNITDANDGPVAGLTVLMDTRGQAIRSELYLDQDSSEADKQEAIRQANLLLKNQFSSSQSEFDNQMFELRIFETHQAYPTVYVDLPEPAQAAPSGGFLGGGKSVSSGHSGSGEASRGGSFGRGALGSGPLGGSFSTDGLSAGVSRFWPLALAALTVLLGIWLVWWILSSFLGGGGFGLANNTAQGDITTEATSGENQAAADFDPNQPILNVASDQGDAVQGEVVQGQAAAGEADQGEVVQGQAAQGESNSATQNVVAQPVQLEWINPSEENRNGLPESIKANPNIGRSSRIRVLQGLQIMLRSHPGPAAGTEIGVMQDGDEGIIVGGPYYTEGDTDTIVWWYARLDSGAEAWVAANTSTLTLLEPAQ